MKNIGSLDDPNAIIHLSLDGVIVVNYTQWKSKEAFEKMLQNPEAQKHMNEASSVCLAGYFTAWNKNCMTSKHGCIS